MTVPLGYIKVTDKNYRLKKYDRIWTSCCGWFIMESRWNGFTTDDFHVDKKCTGIVFYTKGEIRPRFKTDKPFPFGY